MFLSVLWVLGFFTPLSRVGQAFSLPQRQVVNMVSCGLWLCAESQLPAGVLLTAYSRSHNILSDALEQATLTAASFHRFNPDIPVALVTNSANANLSVEFNYIVHAREDLVVDGKLRNDNYTPQWFTRLYYYASSPFEYTYGVDANSVFCGKFHREFRLLRSHDLIVPSQGRDCGRDAFWPHNFDIGFVKNGRTDYLFQKWILLQLQKGIPDDDQSTLFEAIRIAERDAQLKFSMLSRRSAASLHHVNWPVWVPAVSPVLYNPVSLVHPRAGTTNSICAVFNSRPFVHRVAVLLTSGYSVAFSELECNFLTNTSCKPKCLGEKPWLSWPYRIQKNSSAAEIGKWVDNTLRGTLAPAGQGV